MIWKKKIQYYDNAGDAEQARFDRVVAFKDNDFSTLQSNTAAVFTTLTKATTKCGALPGQMVDFVSDMSARKGVLVISGWDAFQGYETDYDHMKDQLNNNIPVIWAVHDWANAFKDGNDPSLERLTFYSYDEDKGTYKASQYAASHYVMVTGIVEDHTGGGHERLLEVSSAGEKVYVDYDEFMVYVAGNEFNAPCASITHTTITN